MTYTQFMFQVRRAMAKSNQNLGSAIAAVEAVIADAKPKATRKKASKKDD